MPLSGDLTGSYVSGGWSGTAAISSLKEEVANLRMDLETLRSYSGNGSATMGLSDAERLAILLGLAGMYESANEFEKGQIINMMVIAGSPLGMYFSFGMTKEAMYQVVLSRPDIIWQIRTVFFNLPPPLSSPPIAKCTCQEPKVILEFPKGGKFWDIIAQEDQ